MQEVIQNRPRRISTPQLLVGGFLLVVGAILVISFLTSDPPITNSNPSNQQAVALGRTLYAANCASCHGATLEGAPNWQQPLADGTMPAPPHDQTGHTWHHNDESLFTTVKYGGQATSPPGYVNRMPAFGGTLSDEEIHAVLAFIKSTWPLEIQQAQQQGHE
jgi:mono/diheme cytochrome c family protein